MSAAVDSLGRLCADVGRRPGRADGRGHADGPHGLSVAAGRSAGRDRTGPGHAGGHRAGGRRRAGAGSRFQGGPHESNQPGRWRRAGDHRRCSSRRAAHQACEISACSLPRLGTDVLPLSTRETSPKPSPSGHGSGTGISLMPWPLSWSAAESEAAAARWLQPTSFLYAPRIHLGMRPVWRSCGRAVGPTLGSLPPFTRSMVDCGGLPPARVFRAR